MGTLFGVAATLVVPSALAADPPATIESPHYTVLSPGYGGELEQNGGAGNEQPSTVAIEKGDDVYLVSVFMNSDVEEGYWQCKCTSMKLSATAAPEIVVDQMQLTNNGGDRPCNHPKIATDGEHIVVTYGTDTNNSNTETYAGVIDEMCGWTADPIRISNNGNNNEGAPDIDYNGEGWFTAGYLSTGNNDRTYARGLRLTTEDGTVALQKEYLQSVVTPANIGRPAIVAASADRTLLCAAKGDNRPPEDGVQCAWLNSMTGEIYWKTYVAESDPENNVYMNQPAVAALDYGRFAVQVVESTGPVDKDENIKGSSRQHLYIIEPTDSGMSPKGKISDIGAYQSHPTICGGAYGTDGARVAAVFDASITGIGQPGIQMVRVSSDATASPSAGQIDNWLVSPWGDAGELAKRYGPNPNSQGRDFLRCIGDVRNPGFAVDGGFKPNVKSFFAAPIAGRILGEEKNALIMGLVPAEVAEPVEPGPPETTGSSVSVGAGGSTSTGASSGNGSGGSNSGANDADTGAPDLGSPAAAASCSYAPPADGREGLLAVLLGLGLITASRRRKEEV